MKIDNSYKSVGSAGGDNRTGKSSKAEADKPAADGTSVALSGQATLLQSIEAKLGSAEVVDTARVAEIKQAIAEGQFKVNPDVVADRLLQTVQDLIRAYKPQ